MGSLHVVGHVQACTGCWAYVSCAKCCLSCARFGDSRSATPQAKQTMLPFAPCWDVKANAFDTYWHATTAFQDVRCGREATGMEWRCCCVLRLEAQDTFLNSIVHARLYRDIVGSPPNAPVCFAQHAMWEGSPKERAESIRCWTGRRRQNSALCAAETFQIPVIFTFIAELLFTVSTSQTPQFLQLKVSTNTLKKYTWEWEIPIASSYFLMPDFVITCCNITWSAVSGVFCPSKLVATGLANSGKRDWKPFEIWKAIEVKTS